MGTAATRRSTIPPGERDRWRTPLALFQALKARYGPFALDVAADATNHLCPLWLGQGGLVEDALALDRWDRHIGLDYPAKRVWCNPPYSRQLLSRFVAKACEQASLGRCSTVLLIPASVDTRWWHDYLWHPSGDHPRLGVDVAFLRGRVHFLRPDGTPVGSPPFASAVVRLDHTVYRSRRAEEVVASWSRTAA